MNSTDWELIAQHIAGDKRALAKIIRRYTPLLRAHITPILRQLESDVRSDTVEDVLQDVWIRVDRFAARLDSNRRFNTWIYTVATNLALNIHRDRRHAPERLPVLVASETGVMDAMDPPDMHSSSRPDLVCENRDTLVNLARYLSKYVSAPNLATLELREIQGYSYDEIARHLQIRPGTVRSRLHRVRSAARQFLRENNK